MKAGSKRAALIGSLIAALILSTGNASSATISGTKCSKVGATKTVANNKYTCIKSGKKLIWNKGVAIKPVATPTPTNAPEPTPTPSPSPTPTKTAEPTLSPSPKPTGPAAPITLDNLDSEWTSVIAYSRMLEFAKNQAKPYIDKTILLSPTVENRPYKLYIQGLDEVVSSLSAIYKSPKFTVVLFTELDSEWIDQTQTRMMGNYLNNPKEQLQSNRLKESGCNIGGFYLPNIILFCVKDQDALNKSISSAHSAAHAFPHEYFHLSGFISSDFTNIPVLGTDASANRRFKSCWIDEGFATFYGFAYGASLSDIDGKGRLAMLNELTYSYDFRRKQNIGTIRKLLLQNDPKTVTALYKEVEGTLENCPDTQNAYFLGELAAEALVATFGAGSLNDFQIEFGKTGDWKSSFEKVFGIKVDDFYVKLTPYLASQALKFTNKFWVT